MTETNPGKTNARVIRFRPPHAEMTSMAVRRADEGDYIGALRILNKTEEFYGKGAETAGMKAHVYGLMDLNGPSVAKWIEYIDFCWEKGATGEDLSAGYDGLFNVFYALGDMESSAYYFNAASALAELGGERADYSLVRGGVIPRPSREEAEEMFGDAEEESEPRPKIRVVWPPEKADYADEIRGGISALRQGQMEAAAEKFLAVPEESKEYPLARNYLAMTFLFAGRADEAEKICEGLLRSRPDDADILCTYATVLADEGKTEESAAAARRLAALPVTEEDELYKAATVCCECGLYEEGYAFLTKMENADSLDRSLTYMKGIAAFKSGRTKEALRILGELLDVYPEAEVARHAYTEIRAFGEGKRETEPELEFVYRVPKPLRDERLGVLAAAMRLPGAERRNFQPDGEFREILDWLFDQIAGGDTSLQYFAAKVCLALNLTEDLRRLLLDYTVPDGIKLEAYGTLCMRNRDFEMSVVIGNIYRRIAYRKLHIGRSNRKVFLEAYSACVIRFALFGDGDPEDYRREIETVYRVLEESGKLGLATSPEALCCVAYLSMREHAMVKGADILQMMKRNKQEVSAILRLRRRQRPASEKDGADEAEEPDAGEDPRIAGDPEAGKADFEGENPEEDG